MNIVLQGFEGVGGGKPTYSKCLTLKPYPNCVERLAEVCGQVTLFHYRKTGARESPVLLGIQVPFGTDKRLLAVIQVKALSNSRLGEAPQ